MYHKKWIVYVLNIISLIIPIFGENWLKDLHIVSENFYYEGDYFFEILEPGELAYIYRVRPAKAFGKPFVANTDPFLTRLVLTIPRDACRDITNADDISGNVALVRRGVCSFQRKAVMVEDAGAKAIIVMDNNYKADNFIEMMSDDEERDTHIPASFLLGHNGYMVKRKLDELGMSEVPIKIPLNITFAEIHGKRQPPWIQW